MKTIFGNRVLQRAEAILLLILLLLTGCATSKHESGVAGPSVDEFSEAYEVYPGIGGSGLSKHLVRSHTTAIAVRPATSTYELCNRIIDQIWDTSRRLEIRLVRFPLLDTMPQNTPSPSAEAMDLVEFEHYLDRLTGKKTSSAHVEFLIDGEQFYPALENSIDTADSSICLQTYLFDNDDVARSIADRLRTRSCQIDVRVLYDGIGTYLSHTATSPSQPEETEFIGNIPRYLCEGSNVRLRVYPNILLSGNHVKSMIFDQRVAYVGGMNIGREYLHDWHDMMFRLEGAAVGELIDNFENTWRHSGWGGDFALLSESLNPSANRKLHPDEVPVRFLYTKSGTAQIYRAQLEAIRRARKYVYIENCYFADDRILYELCRAGRRGVDVRIILPKEVNHKVMEHSNRVAINTLLKHGGRVFLYPRMSHVKAAVYDDWACVGTANFDKLSLQVIREINLATSHPGTVETLIECLFKPDFEKSTELTEPVDCSLKDHLIELVADET